MKITKTKTYTVREPLQNGVEVKFMNRKGAWDIVQFTRYEDFELKTKPQNFSSSGVERVYTVNSTSTQTFYSTYLTENEFNWLKDLILSPAVYVNGKYVRVQDSSYKFDSSQKLFTIELTVCPEFEENKISL